VSLLLGELRSTKSSPENFDSGHVLIVSWQNWVQSISINRIEWNLCLNVRVGEFNQDMRSIPIKKPRNYFAWYLFICLLCRVTRITLFHLPKSLKNVEHEVKNIYLYIHHIYSFIYCAELPKLHFFICQSLTKMLTPPPTKSLQISSICQRLMRTTQNGDEWTTFVDVTWASREKYNKDQRKRNVIVTTMLIRNKMEEKYNIDGKKMSKKRT
jgi:hypothetical protein